MLNRFQLQTLKYGNKYYAYINTLMHFIEKPILFLVFFGNKKMYVFWP